MYRNAPFTFDFIANLIHVDEDVTDVYVPALYQVCKLAQGSVEGMLYDRIAKGSGLVNLGGGVQVGLTVEILGDWQIKFSEGNRIVRFFGGNLVGGPNGDPVAYSAGVQTLLIQSAASTVVLAGGGGGLTTAQNSKLMSLPSLTQIEESDVLVKRGDVLNANIVKVNNVAVNGTGAEGDEWGPSA